MPNASRGMRRENRPDVFREPHDGDRWGYGLDPLITLSYDELIL
ncbi:hypothetical protein [Nocardia sp. CA-145437]